MPTPKSKPHPPESTPITDKLREVITSRCPTAYDAAQQSGCDIRSIDRFLKRERGLTSESIDRLARSFNLRLVEIEVRPVKSRPKPRSTS